MRPPPATTDLLRAAPFDRITLIDGTVLVVEPVSPRPLPPSIRPRTRTEAASTRPKPGIPEEGNIIVGRADQARDARQREGSRPGRRGERRGQAPSAARRAQRGPSTSRSSATNIKKIEYFEDLLAGGVRSAGDGARLCPGLRVLPAGADAQPGLAGLDDHVNRVLFAEGSKALIDGDGERGLRLLARAPGAEA